MLDEAAKAMTTIGSVVGAGTERTVTQLAAYHREWESGDPKHVPWAAAFRHSASGTDVGQRAMLREEKQPCEVILRREEDAVMIRIPRLDRMELVEVGELEPYSYEKSSLWRQAIGDGAVCGPTLDHFVGAEFMNKMDVLFERIRKDARLWAELKKVSLPDDGTDVSFMIGFSARTGVPYTLMSGPLIAELWLAVRDKFLVWNKNRVSGTKLTNIKITIDVQDTKLRKITGDLGDAVVISGGTHVGGELEWGGQSKTTWGQFKPLDRSRPHKWTPWTGEQWTMTMFRSGTCGPQIPTLARPMRR